MPDVRASREADLDQYLTHGFLPWRRSGGKLVAAAAGCDHAQLRARLGDCVIVPVTRAVLDWAIAWRFRDSLIRRAVWDHCDAAARPTARLRISDGQVWALGSALAMLVLSMAAAPDLVLQIFLLSMSAGYLCGALMRLYMAALFCRRRRTAIMPSDKDLPVYTVLAPLYREAGMLPQLARALTGFDYPRDRLDIKLVVEEDDNETLRAAESVARQYGFDLVSVPVCQPRTKPKALNYALPFARGEFLAVYDAEDRPEPMQLRKAVAGFREGPPDLCCLQARLAIGNGHRGLLPALFAVDYAVWFGAVLGAVAGLRAPMPLGGTSNHFKIAVLRAAGGWDPYNVTEDADLGLRLARMGGRVAMLDSDTIEDAPLKLGVWLKQRSRWFKGYVQTVLVHSRELDALVAAIGPRGVAVMAFLFGGALWAALANPILLGISLLSAWRAPIRAEGSFIYLAMGSGLSLLSANTLLTAMVALQDGMAGLRRIWFGLGFLLYWVMIPLAAARGLVHLVHRPFHWEKTPHAPGGC